MSAAGHQGHQYLAYTNPSDSNVYVAGDNNNNFVFATPVKIPGATTSSDPAMVAGNDLYNKFYVSYINYGVAYITSSVDGLFWGTPAPFYTPPLKSSPGMTVGPDGNIYLAFTNAMDNTIVECTYTPQGSQSCYSPGSQAINFHPNLTFFKGSLILAFESYDNNHALGYYSQPLGTQQITLGNMGPQFDSTSAAPSVLAVASDILLFGFRGNDSNGFFYTKALHASVGGNFWIPTAVENYSMQGPPNLVFRAGQEPQSTAINVFVQNGAANYILTSNSTNGF